MRRAPLLVAAAFLTIGASWIDPNATAREASRLYAGGNFASAATKYNEALVDDPDSPLLHYNLGASVYKQGKYEEAVTAYSQTPGADVGDVTYNVGNAKYRLGVETEASDPERALSLYAEALAAYRRAMGADPTDDDAKFNHEFVTRKIAELQKKLEEQKQKQEQEKKDQQQAQKQDQQQRAGDQQQPPPSDEQKPGEPRDSESEQNAGKGDQPKDRSENQQSPQGQQAKEDQQPGSAAEQAAAAAGDQQAEMSEREAQALLDAARDQEARPDEITRRMQRGQVLEPAEDW